MAKSMIHHMSLSLILVSVHKVRPDEIGCRSSHTLSNNLHAFRSPDHNIADQYTDRFQRFLEEIILFLFDLPFLFELLDFLNIASLLCLLNTIPHLDFFCIGIF